MSLKGAFLVLTSTLSPLSALAADLGVGEQLHQENCIACHTSLMKGDHSQIYTRENRRVSSYPGLVKQVGLCEQTLGLTWFDEDIENVSAYLNATYYKF